MDNVTMRDASDDAIPWFTLAGHQEMLRGLLGRGYELVSFSEVVASQPHLILRHDIDMSLSAALALAEAEARAGFSATYFVLMRSELYNPMSLEGVTQLRAIAELGHEIGLHLDPSLYPDDSSAVEAGASDECARLEAATGRPVDIISFHRPAPALLNLERDIAGRKHAYQPRYFSDIGYCSDSRGEWRFGNPFSHEVVQARRALQLVTHPIWWYRDVAEAPSVRTARFVRERAQLFDLEVAANCIVHQPTVVPESA